MIGGDEMDEAMSGLRPVLLAAALRVAPAPDVDWGPGDLIDETLAERQREYVDGLTEAADRERDANPPGV
jgi:hypothetical protein